MNLRKVNSVERALFRDDALDPCRSYINVRSGDKPFLKKARERCEDLWRCYESFADPHFLDEFPRHFHQRWFEMWLSVYFLRHGLHVECPYPGPDIGVRLDGRRIWIEVVCPTAGEEGKPDSVPRLQEGRVGNVPIDAFALRVLNALHGKADQFKKYVQQGIVQKEDWVFVAINVSDMGRPLDPGPHLDAVMQKALWGVGDPVVHMSRDSGSILGTSFLEVESINKKSSGASVSVEPFLDESMAHVSAAWAFLGNAANDSAFLAGNCILYTNPSSRNPWPRGAVPFGMGVCAERGRAGFEVPTSSA